MMSELEKMFATGETGRSKMSPAQAAEKLELMKNPDGSLKFPIIPDLCKIMAAFSAIKKKKSNRQINISLLYLTYIHFFILLLV